MAQSPAFGGKGGAQPASGGQAPSRPPGFWDLGSGAVPGFWDLGSGAVSSSSSSSSNWTAQPLDPEYGDAEAACESSLLENVFRKMMPREKMPPINECSSSDSAEAADSRKQMVDDGHPEAPCESRRILLADLMDTDVGHWQHEHDDADIDEEVDGKWLIGKERKALLAQQAAKKADVERRKMAVQVEMLGIVVECKASIRIEVGAELQDGAPELAPELEPERPMSAVRS